MSSLTSDHYERLMEYYNALKQFLSMSVAPQKSNPNRAAKARGKLLKLSMTQFYELSTDVYDELQRRISESQEEPDFLLPMAKFHPKRNEAREKLGSLQPGRFRDLVSDIFYEIERRGLHLPREDEPVKNVEPVSKARSPVVPPTTLPTATQTGVPNGVETGVPEIIDRSVSEIQAHDLDNASTPPMNNTNNLTVDDSAMEEVKQPQNTLKTLQPSSVIPTKAEMTWTSDEEEEDPDDSLKILNTSHTKTKSLEISRGDIPALVPANEKKLRSSPTLPLKEADSTNIPVTETSRGLQHGLSFSKSRNKDREIELLLSEGTKMDEKITDLEQKNALLQSKLEKLETENENLKEVKGNLMDKIAKLESEISSKGDQEAQEVQGKSRSTQLYDLTNDDDWKAKYDQLKVQKVEEYLALDTISDEAMEKFVSRDGLIPSNLLTQLQESVRSYLIKLNDSSLVQSPDVFFDCISYISDYASKIAKYAANSDKSELIRASVSHAITSTRYFTLYSEIMPKLIIQRAVSEVVFSVCDLVADVKLNNDLDSAVASAMASTSQINAKRFSGESTLDSNTEVSPVRPLRMAKSSSRSVSSSNQATTGVPPSLNTDMDNNIGTKPFRLTKDSPSISRSFDRFQGGQPSDIKPSLNISPVMARFTPEIVKSPNSTTKATGLGLRKSSSQAILSKVKQFEEQDQSAKTSPQFTPKVSPKVNPKASPKASPKVNPKASPKASPKAHVVNPSSNKVNNVIEQKDSSAESPEHLFNGFSETEKKVTTALENPKSSGSVKTEEPTIKNGPILSGVSIEKQAGIPPQVEEKIEDERSLLSKNVNGLKKSVDNSLGNDAAGQTVEEVSSLKDTIPQIKSTNARGNILTNDDSTAAASPEPSMLNNKTAVGAVIGSAAGVIASSWSKTSKKKEQNQTTEEEEEVDIEDFKSSLIANNNIKKLQHQNQDDSDGAFSLKPSQIDSHIVVSNKSGKSAVPEDDLNFSPLDEKNEKYDGNPKNSLNNESTPTNTWRLDSLVNDVMGSSYADADAAHHDKSQQEVKVPTEDQAPSQPRELPAIPNNEVINLDSDFSEDDTVIEKVEPLKTPRSDISTRSVGKSESEAPVIRHVKVTKKDLGDASPIMSPGAFPKTKTSSESSPKLPTHSEPTHSEPTHSEPAHSSFSNSKRELDQTAVSSPSLSEYPTTPLPGTLSSFPSRHDDDGDDVVIEAKNSTPVTSSTPLVPKHRPSPSSVPTSMSSPAPVSTSASTPAPAVAQVPKSLSTSSASATHHESQHQFDEDNFDVDEFDIDNPDNTLSELLLYLEHQTVKVISTIQALLSAIKLADSTKGELRNDSKAINDVISQMVQASSTAMNQSRNAQLKEHGGWVVDSLSDCGRRMNLMCTSTGEGDEDDDYADKSFKQRLAGIAFDVAKCTKELVKSVEEANLKEEIEHLNARLG